MSKMKGTLFALLSSETFAGDSAIEIVELATMHHVRTVVLTQWGYAHSLAVSPDQTRVYVTDWNRGIGIIDPWSGSVLAEFGASIANDCVLSEKGETLFVSTNGWPPGPTVVAIDTATYARQTIAVDSINLYEIELSPSGRLLAAIGQLNGGGSAVFLFDVATFTLSKTITIPGAQTATDLAWIDDTRIAVWDSGTDSLYQIDVPSGTQLNADTVSIGANNWFDFLDNRVAYSAARGRAYTLRTADPPAHAVLAAFDPVALTYKLYDGFNGLPYAMTLTADGAALLLPVTYKYLGGGAATLDVFDTSTHLFTRAVYTFPCPTMMVTDLKVAVFTGDSYIDAVRAASYLTHILAGVRDDGPGVVQRPGQPPRPEPPWGPWFALPAPLREIVGALLISQAAGLLSDEAARRDIQRIALGAAQNRMQQLLDSIGAG